MTFRDEKRRNIRAKQALFQENKPKQLFLLHKIKFLFSPQRSLPENNVHAALFLPEHCSTIKAWLLLLMATPPANFRTASFSKRIN